MLLVVGLGNPGNEYEATRHNVGFRVADLLADRARSSFSEKKWKARLARTRIAGSDAQIMKPETYMNLSGEAVGPALGFYKLPTSELVVVHDELDLEPGRVKLKKGGGHGGHNGLRSLIQHLPDAEFVRVRIGIGRPPPGRDSADYVLSRVSKDERELMDRAIEDAADAVESIVKDGLPRAMSRWNAKESE
jgi:PTH1 family peptidyl-tRNA hydrolase